jgi:hypothetical protein
MKRLLISAAALGLVVATATVYPQAQGRQGGGGGGFTNLQVLPADIAAPDLIAIMQAAEAALGVDCAYCHVFNGRGAAGNDMASDEKRPKLVAREMVRMMEQANETIAVATGKGPGEVAEVTCMTCHRGSTIPEIEDAPAAD